MTDAQKEIQQMINFVKERTGRTVIDDFTLPATVLITIIAELEKLEFQLNRSLGIRIKKPQVFSI